MGVDPKTTQYIKRKNTLFKTIVLLTAAALTLSACGNPDQVYGAGLVPQKITGDENSVNVFNVWSAGDAMPLASRWCDKYDKTPVFVNMSLISANFDCK